MRDESMTRPEMKSEIKKETETTKTEDGIRDKRIDKTKHERWNPRKKPGDREGRIERKEKNRRHRIEKEALRMAAMRDPNRGGG